MLGVAARSVIEEVGRPTTKKKASIFLSLTCVDGLGDAEPLAPMSLSLSRPAASMTRKANTSVALPGEPVETRLPFRSSTLSMPVPSTVTTCM